MSIEQELAEMGLRLAGNWELGWYVNIVDGCAFWVTDDCKMNVLGTYWQICGASSYGPCMCNVIVVAGKHTLDDPRSRPLPMDGQDYHHEGEC